MKLFYPLFYVSMVLISSCALRPSLVTKDLSDSTWHFKNKTDTLWSPAKVPGTVHTDLLNIGKIEDPFFRLNEHDVQWIDKEDWEYSTSFELTKRDLSKQQIDMDFLGLDTYSEIYVNDSLCLKTDNMFRHYTTNVKDILKVGTNNLRIVFISPVKKGIEKYDALGYKIPVSDNDLAKIGKVEDNKKVSVFTRKAGYHFGWDWGPRLVTSGIWKPIKLKAWNAFKLDDVYIQQQIAEDKAHLIVSIDALVFKDAKIKDPKVEIFVNDELVKTTGVTLIEGKNSIDVPVDIDNPKLWWPNGMGEQTLYNVEVKLSANNYEDSMSRKIGLRTIELVREPDSIGTSFYFKVNGHPVFIKGANYIPQDPFLTRATSSHYEHILSSAKEANMNMLRVWGGGTYETNEFYDLCDAKGLLVWQDFMFACAMFPGDESFLENVRQEAIDNVKRLRNHPSLALWCGNNEILAAWEDWGWKKKETAKQSKEVADIIWKSYDDIFHKVLPEVVSKYDGGRVYWPSSPGSDFGKKQTFESGDAHYWDVWWGKQPFDKYNEVIPRFMSEYGFQSFPVMSSVEKYAIPEDYDIYSDVMKSHQRSSIGNETVEEYMLRHYRKPKDFESFLYVSQLLQAHGIKIGMESHRRNRARCMGSLYWQINDCWPVASWSSIDYYGKWKAVHYTAKEAFKKFLITHNDGDNQMDIYVVSDSLDNLDAILKVQCLDFDGKVLKSWEEQINVLGNESNKHFNINKKALLASIDARNVLFTAELLDSANGRVLANNIIYLSEFKDLNLPEPNLSYTIKDEGDRFSVVIKTEKLAKDIFVSTSSVQNFSDNFFDMLPHTEKTITIKKEGFNDLASFANSLKIMTLRDTF